MGSDEQYGVLVNATVWGPFLTNELAVSWAEYRLPKEIIHEGDWKLVKIVMPE